ncbi:vitamin D3 receptor-like isoform X2 [Babylonia areolata]|uniref:vitamin D3 receptor-like isoform X2 n=1 Tax=Babylonia areolata TaxID=304850 RepID=UPI003FD58971
MASSSSGDSEPRPSSSAARFSPDADTCPFLLPQDMGSEEKNEVKANAKKEQKRRPKPRDGTQLYCGVCSDKALGYNFDAITCESCKAFFRRNANKSKSFSCSFDGNCKLDPHTRKFCSGCRLRKCFAIGMKKDWILSDDQLAKRRSRLRLRSATSSTSNLSEQESPSSSGEISTTTSAAGDSPPPSAPQPHASPTDHQIKEEPAEEENYSIPLRRDIRENLLMMQKTYDDIFEATYSVEQSKNLKANPDSSSDLFNMTDIFIRRLIKFAKCIPEFKALKQEDQIHLLKGGIMEMFVLRSAMSFDLKKGGWQYRSQQQTGTVTEGQVDPRSLHSNLGTQMYTDHMQFLLSIHKLTNSDRYVLMLLFVIGLMTADRPKLENKTLVCQAQEKFSMWLRAYLESTLTVSEAQALYPKLLMKLIDVRHLGEASSHLAASLDISRLEPLLVEVFDLK